MLDLPVSPSFPCPPSLTYKLFQMLALALLLASSSENDGGHCSSFQAGKCVADSETLPGLRQLVSNSSSLLSTASLTNLLMLLSLVITSALWKVGSQGNTGTEKSTKLSREYTSSLLMRTATSLGFMPSMFPAMIAQPMNPPEASTDQTDTYLHFPSLVTSMTYLLTSPLPYFQLSQEMSQMPTIPVQ